MDPRKITRLAKLLRENGDKVLSSEYKITLTGPLLRALNDSFTLITDPNETWTPNTFQVLRPNNADSDVFRELQIIYDFVQKAQILCLVAMPTEEPFDGEIDIKNFRNLKRLEIQRIQIDRIIGIQRLRPHLQELICSKSIQSIQSIIAHCGGDNANGFLWNELKMADFSYNSLKTIDCSLEFVSNLQQLNLSHNQIVSVDAIRWLPNLKKLNLSFNSLAHIPRSITSRRLQSLIVTNNCIEDLQGLPKLEALNELDLAYNCIIDHAALEPLGSLIALQHLQLHGNPIACHPNHREETCKYLHKNVASVKFILDSRPLTKYEKNLVGYYQSFNNWSSRFPMKGRVSLQRSSGLSTPSRLGDITPASSIGSIQSFRFDGSSNSTVDLSQADDANVSQLSSSTQKRNKVREALIADDENDENDENVEGIEIVMAKSKEKEKLKTKSVDFDEMGSREHLKTKQQIEDLRKEFGENWLQKEGASKMQDVMGIPAQVSTKTTEEKLEDIFRLDNVIMDRAQTSTPVQHSPSSSHNDHFQSMSSTGEFQSIINSEESSGTMKSTNDSTMENSTDSMEKTKFSVDDTLGKVYPTTETETEQVSDDEENETNYLVTNQTNRNTQMFLVVSDQSIREKNALTLKRINKWAMTMLESCERLSSDVLRIRFDTVRRDKRERVYRFENDEGRKLDEFLRNVLSQRPITDIMIIYRCALCANTFSQEKLPRKNGKEVKCTKCGSPYVVEIKDSLPQPSEQSSPPKQSEIVQLEKSNSHSSIDSASSFNESLSQSKISSYSQSSFDSNQSQIGSTTNCEHTNDLDSYFASRFGAQPESDVEILSNPSISSIEVLDRFSRQSSRKQSDDSRYLLQTQLYVQQHQHQFNKSNDGSDCQSPSLDLLIKSTSNSDIEEILDEPDPTTLHPIEQITIEQADGATGVRNEKTEVNETARKPTQKYGLTAMNLTESSSSGSMTSSVCTAIGNQAVDSKAIDDTTSILATKVTTSEQEIPIAEPELETSKLAESSSIWDVFNPVSISLLSRTKSSPKPTTPPPPCDKFKFSYTDFDSTDHRLKLYLYQSIFEDANEHLKWLVKGCLFNDATHSDPDAKLQPAIFVMSTTKWYVLNIIGRESDDMTKWIKRDAFGTINRVEIVRVLPWKVGITFTIKNYGNIHFFLQDIMRTDTLLLFFANNPLPVYCDLEYQISERLSQKLLQITNNVQLKMFTILNNCEITDHKDNKVSHKYPAFILTDSHLYVTTPKYGWLIEKLDRNIEVAKIQLMSDLVEVENITETSFTLSFLDENRDQNEKWECKFETESCLKNTFETLDASWQKLFKVPLAN